MTRFKSKTTRAVTTAGKRRHLFYSKGASTDLSLPKSGYRKSKSGKIVSKRASNVAKRAYERASSPIRQWAEATKRVSKYLPVTVPMRKGSAAYQETRKVYNAM